MRFVLVWLVSAALSACSYIPWFNAEAPHSEYYVVFFTAATATPLAEGRAAIVRAAQDAERGAPHAVTVRYYVSADGTGKDLSEARMQAVTQALVEGGFPKERIQVVAQATDPQSFGRLGDGVVVQVERGEPAPAAPAAAEATADSGSSCWLWVFGC